MIVFLVSQCVWQYYVAVNEELVEVVSRVLSDLPCSERQLALDAGLAPSTLSRIRSGERTVSADTVLKLADALAGWADRSSTAEQTLRRALESEERL